MDASAFGGGPVRVPACDAQCLVGRWQAGVVRYSEFWDAVDDAFGRQMGRVLVAEQVIEALGDCTAQQALDAGREPRAVWRALCDAMQVPEVRRWGPDRPSR